MRKHPFVFLFVSIISFFIGFSIHSVLKKSEDLSYQYINSDITEELENFQVRPSTKYIFINSNGGNIGVALDIAEQIVGRDIVVVVETHCYSACNIIYQAAKYKYAKKNAKFGFHAASSLEKDAHLNRIITRESNLFMREFFITAGMSPQFINEWIYSKNLTIYTAEQMYKRGYVNYIID